MFSSSAAAFLPAFGNRGPLAPKFFKHAACSRRSSSPSTSVRESHFIADLLLLSPATTYDGNNPVVGQHQYATRMNIDADNVNIPADMISAAHEAADASGSVLRRYFRSSPGELSTAFKTDGSPVTAADTAAEAAIRGVLEAKFPAHQVLGEEKGGAEVENLSHAEWAWVVDPIDGTKAFMCGRPTFGTLIALLHYGTPAFGIIDQPVSRERWAGGNNHPTQLNGKIVSVFKEVNTTTTTTPDSDKNKKNNTKKPLASMVVHATTPDMFIGADGNAWELLKQHVGGVVYGADCYAYALLSSGFVELVVEADLKPWDFLALVPVVEAAGGVFVDWNGEKVGPKSDGRVVAAASSGVMEEVVEILSLES